MIKTIFKATAAALAIGASVPGFAQKSVVVGGAEMSAAKDIVDNASNSKDHTTLVAAVKAAGLVETLKSPGPFTVFAPTNDAFKMLPPGTVESWLKPEAKPKLTGVLTYHVLAGKVDAADIARKIKQGHGTAILKTVQGGSLTAVMKGKDILIRDTKGTLSQIMIPDVIQKNGIIHVINHVLLP